MSVSPAQNQPIQEQGVAFLKKRRWANALTTAMVVAAWLAVAGAAIQAKADLVVSRDTFDQAGTDGGAPSGFGTGTIAQSALGSSPATGFDWTLDTLRFAAILSTANTPNLGSMLNQDFLIVKVDQLDLANFNINDAKQAYLAGQPYQYADFYLRTAPDNPNYHIPYDTSGTFHLFDLTFGGFNFSLSANEAMYFGVIGLPQGGISGNLGIAAKNTLSHPDMLAISSIYSGDARPVQDFGLNGSYAVTFSGTSVPEPSSLLILAAATVGIVLASRGRRKTVTHARLASPIHRSTGHGQPEVERQWRSQATRRLELGLMVGHRDLFGGCHLRTLFSRWAGRGLDRLVRQEMTSRILAIIFAVMALLISPGRAVGDLVWVKDTSQNALPLLGAANSMENFGALASIRDNGVLYTFNVDNHLDGAAYSQVRLNVQLLENDTLAGLTFYVGVYHDFELANFADRYSMEGFSGSVGYSSTAPDEGFFVTDYSFSFLGSGGGISRWQVAFDLTDSGILAQAGLTGMGSVPFDPSNPNRVAGLGLTSIVGGQAIVDRSLDNSPPSLMSISGWNDVAVSVGVTQAIPEPSSFGLLGLASIIPLCFRRRRSLLPESTSRPTSLSTAVQPVGNPSFIGGRLSMTIAVVASLLNLQIFGTHAAGTARADIVAIDTLDQFTGDIALSTVNSSVFSASMVVPLGVMQHNGVFNDFSILAARPDGVNNWEGKLFGFANINDVNSFLSPEFGLSVLNGSTYAAATNRIDGLTPNEIIQTSNPQVDLLRFYGNGVNLIFTAGMDFNLTYFDYSTTFQNQSFGIGLASGPLNTHKYDAGFISGGVIYNSQAGLSQNQFTLRAEYDIATVPEPNVLSLLGLASIIPICFRRRRSILPESDSHRPTPSRIEHRVAAPAATSKKLNRALALGILAVVAIFANAGQVFGDLVTFYSNTTQVQGDPQFVPDTITAGIASASTFGVLDQSSDYFDQDRVIRRVFVDQFFDGGIENFRARIGLVNTLDSQGNIDPFLYNTNTHYNSALNSYVTNEALRLSPSETMLLSDGFTRVFFDVEIPVGAGQIAFPIVAFERLTSGGSAVRALGGSHKNDFLHDAFNSNVTDLVGNYNYSWNSGDHTAIRWGAEGTVQGIPEPSSLTLLGLASIIPLCFRRRRPILPELVSHQPTQNRNGHRANTPAASSRALAVGILTVVAVLANAGRAFADLVTFFDNTNIQAVSSEAFPIAFDTNSSSSALIGLAGSHTTGFHLFREVREISFLFAMPGGNITDLEYIRIGNSINPLLYNGIQHFNAGPAGNYSNFSWEQQFLSSELNIQVAGQIGNEVIYSGFASNIQGFSLLPYQNASVPFTGLSNNPTVSPWMLVNSYPLGNGASIDDMGFFKAASNNTQQLSDFDNFLSGDNTAAMYAVRGDIVGVPEPSAFCLLGLASVIPLCFRRRRPPMCESALHRPRPNRAEPRVAAPAASRKQPSRALAIGILAVVAVVANAELACGDLVTFRDTTSSASTSIGGAPSHADVTFQSVGMPILSADPLARDILELDFIFGKSTNGLANIGDLANYNFEISQLNAATLSTYDIVQHYNFIRNNQLYSSHVTDRLRVSAPAGIENPYNTSGQYHLHRGTFAVDFYLPADTVGAYSAIGLPQNGEGSVLLLQFSNGSNFQDWIDLSNDPRFAVLNTDFPAPLAEYAFAARGSYTVPEPSALCLLGFASIIPLCFRRRRQLMSAV